MKVSVLPIFLIQIITNYDFVFNQIEICNSSTYLSNDTRIDSGVFHTINKTGLLTCVIECMLRSSCNSFNYHNDSRICELSMHSSTVATAQLTSDIGYQHSDISLWPQSLSGRCDITSCPKLHKCAELSSGNTVCLLSECKHPPNVDFSTVDLTERGVNRSVNYKCNAGYAMVGNPTVTCKANGLWTKLNFMCTKCPDPPAVQFATVWPGDTLIGTLRGYTCQAGYVMSSGYNAVECLPDRTWSLPPYCDVASRFITSPSGEVSLYGHSNTNVGRVEIFRDQQWGTVCHDLFDDVDATVVCQELGFSYGKGYCCGHYGTASDNIPIWMNDVACYGNETSITECPHAVVNNCVHSKDAGVRCYV